MRRILYLLIALGSGLFLGAFFFPVDEKISVSDISAAQRLSGTRFNNKEMDSLLPILEDFRKNYESLRKFNLGNSAPLAIQFNPLPPGFVIDKMRVAFKTASHEFTKFPKDSNDLSWYTIGQLAELIRTKQITSLGLTKFFIARLKKYDKKLLCVITLMEELAYRQAKKADEEIKEGRYKGILHGIPYGIKDMFFTKDVKTTFGTTPFKDQLIDEDAVVVKKLREAGAILIAKLSLGELAMDDTWYGGKTRCPWDTTKGSSGSSAGPASAVAAGLVPFAIGSETWGSIVSPCTVNGVTGLRPTFGRISRTGAMVLSWTMDKVGPICRNSEDCAIVFNALLGPDPMDQTLTDLPFNYYPGQNLKKMKIGYLVKEFEKDSANKKFNDEFIALLKSKDVELIPVTLPDLPVNDLAIILFSECSEAFHELSISDRDDLMAQQGKYNWPNFFRSGHFIPAVQYLRANRVRYKLMQEMNEKMKGLDILLAPSLAGDNLLVTNLTGHPCVVIPNGFIGEKTPVSIVAIGQLYDEGKLLSFTNTVQLLTEWHKKHPKGF